MATFNVTSGSESISGTADNDQFTGTLGGNDTLSGLGGNDQFAVNRFVGGVYDGGSGDDTVFADEALGNVQFFDMETLALGQYGVVATAAQINQFDWYVSSYYPDGRLSFVLHGAGGTLDFLDRTEHWGVSIIANDATSGIAVTGTGTDDWLHGSAHDDTLIGGDGNDTLQSDATIGDMGADSLSGGGGNDAMDAMGGADTFDGGDGNDTIAFYFGDYSGAVDGGAGFDVVSIIEVVPDVTFTNVERLSLTNAAYEFYASIDQLNHFETIGEDIGIPDGTRFTLFLNGPGGMLDLSSKMTANPLNVNATALTATAVVTGTVFDDMMMASAVGATLNGTAGDDTLIGDESADFLDGGIGDDWIDGRAGFDTVRGGAGNDTILVATAYDTRINGGVGIDVAYADDGYLGNGTFQNVEILDLNDIFAFGAVSQLNSFQSIISSNMPDGPLFFTLAGAGGTFDASSRVAGRGIIVDGTVVTSALNLTGTGLDDQFFTSPTSTLDGGGGNDTLSSGMGADSLTGGTGDDDLNAGMGMDTVDGGAGSDTFFVADGHGGMMTGGADNDLLISFGSLGNVSFSGIETLDLFENEVQGTVAQLASFQAITGSFGIGDPLDFELMGAGGTLDLSTKVTQSVRIGTDGLAGALNVAGGGGDDTLNGTVSADTLDGRGGNDMLSSFDGDDSLIGGDGNDVLQASSGADTLIAGAGNDYLHGGSGVNRYVAGAGNDTIVVEVGNDGIVNGGADVDTVLAYDSLNDLVFLNVEELSLAYIYVDATIAQFRAFDTILYGYDLTLRGGAGTIDFSTRITDRSIIIHATDLAGGAKIIGTDFDDLFTASAAGGTIMGGDGYDTIIGTTGNDWFDGGAGYDSFDGGSGNDTYVVDDAADLIYEEDGLGTDMVRSSTSWTLDAGLEDLVLTGNEATDGTGNAAANMLVGNSAANRLDGGAGADTMKGGNGSDTYIVDDADDVVFETATGGAGDTVRASVDHTLAVHVEKLVFTTNGDLAGTGNVGNNGLTGGTGNNSLYGLQGADTLIGNDGDDLLDGGIGIDSLRGGAGNDTYVIDNTADEAIEAGGSGFDLARITANYTLAGGLEDLLVANNAAVSGTGNALHNTMTGGGGANLLRGMAGRDTIDGAGGGDMLEGGGGNDSLTGGSGADSFIFAAGSGVDRIGDFADAIDRLDVSAFGYHDLAELQAAGGSIAAAGADTRVMFNNMGDQVLLIGVTAASITAADFLWAA